MAAPGERGAVTFLPHIDDIQSEVQDTAINMVPKMAASERGAVTFLPHIDHIQSEAQDIAIKMVQRDLMAVEREEREALRVLEERRKVYSDILEHEHQAKRARLRRSPPSKSSFSLPLPIPFEASAKIFLKRNNLKRQRDELKQRKEMAEREEINARMKEMNAMRSKRASILQSKFQSKLRKQQEESVKAKASEDAKRHAEESARRAAIEKAASRARARLVPVECPACGIVVNLGVLSKHQKEDCENRKVPCKNWQAGCTCMVRVCDRARHEDATALMRPRACLWFGGPTAPSRVAIDEDDISAPWTAEFWIYRPSLSVAAVNLTTKALELRATFLELWEIMADFKLHIDQLNENLVDAIENAEQKKAEKRKNAKAKSKSGKTANQKGLEKQNNDLPYEAMDDTADILLAANQEYETAAVRVAAIRAGWADMIGAAARRLADADAELKENDPRGSSTSKVAFFSPSDLEAALQPILSYFFTSKSLNSQENKEGSSQGISPEDEQKDDRMTEKSEAKKSKIKRIKPPRDWLAGCSTTRQLIDLIKANGQSERAAHASMIAMFTESKEENGSKNGTSEDLNNVSHAKVATKQSARARRKEKRKLKQRQNRLSTKAETSAPQGLKLSQKIERAVRGRQGRDTIAASTEGLRLQLEIGESDEVGISIPDLGEFTFTDGLASSQPKEPSRGVLPRGRWVHVAFVATKKNRLLCYLDGRVIQRHNNHGSVSSVTSSHSNEKKDNSKQRKNDDENGINLELLQKECGNLRLAELQSGAVMKNDVVFGLPSRDIGEALPPGRNPIWGIVGPSCFHGAMQEVRYWAVARTKAEIRSTYRKLLDEKNSPKEGLIGWWSFEEGKGSRYAADVTEGRFRNRLVGLNMKRKPYFDSSLRPKQMDQRNLRHLLHCLRPRMEWRESEEVSAGQEPPPTPAWRERAACAVELRRVKLAIRGRKLFEQVSCVLGCGREDIARKNMRFHIIHECAERRVQCWVCGMGGIKFGLNGEGLLEHTRSSCPATIRREKLLAISKGGATPVPCVLCGEAYRKRVLARHMAHECHERLVSCPEGCGLRIVAHRLERHQREWCDAPSVVALRGMVTRSRKNRPYSREWNLLSSSMPLEVEDADEKSEEGDEDNDEEEEEEEEGR